MFMNVKLVDILTFNSAIIIFDHILCYLFVRIYLAVGWAGPVVRKLPDISTCLFPTAVPGRQSSLLHSQPRKTTRTGLGEKILRHSEFHQYAAAVPKKKAALLRLCRTTMAEYLASIFGTEKDKVNCSFYFKIGACRHGDRCSRIHNKPTFSQTIVLQATYSNNDGTAVNCETKKEELSSNRKPPRPKLNNLLRLIVEY